MFFSEITIIEEYEKNGQLNRQKEQNMTQVYDKL